MLGWNAVGEVAHVKVSGLDIIASDCNAWKTPRAGNGAIVSLANIKDAKYRDIVIENVRSEVPVNQVFFLVTKGTAAGFDQGLGDVDGLVFRNISVPGKPRLKGLFNGNGTNTGAIKNVTFDNVRIGGTLLTAENADQHIEQQGKTSEFTYTDSPANKSKSP